MDNSELYSTLKKFPKTDLHRHLEGSILPETFIEIAQKYGGTLPTYNIQELQPLIQVVNDPPGFHNFLNKFKVFRCFYPCLEAVEEIAYRAVQQAAEDAVKYLELRYSPSHFSCSGNFKEDEVIYTVQKAIDRACRQFDITVIPIVTISRDYGIEVAEGTVTMVTSLSPGFFYGLDLAGNEINNSALPFFNLFTLAKTAGLGLTIHAGEAGGAANVREAVVNFHAERIGHGIRAADDEELLGILRERNTLLEVCLTSNLQTGVVASIKDHPLKKLLKHNVPVSLNSDDPAISAITLTDEYLLAMTQLDFTLEDLKALNRAALEHAFYPDKKELKERLYHLWE